MVEVLSLRHIDVVAFHNTSHERILMADGGGGGAAVCCCCHGGGSDSCL